MQVRTFYIVAVLIALFAGCSERLLDVDTEKAQQKHKLHFVSARYNHFADGLIIPDINEGADLLWRASFKNGIVYKENLAFLIAEGLLITPNESYSSASANLSVYATIIENGKLMVLYKQRAYAVLGIVHTHPGYGPPKPTPRYDFQFGYMGVHNFIISRNDIYDAIKDKAGKEMFRRIGARGESHMILAAVRNEPIKSKWQR
jgi:hypothetical protein